MKVLREQHYNFRDIDIDWDEDSDSVSGRVNGKLAFLLDGVSDVIDLGDIEYFGDDESLYDYLIDNGLMYRGF